MPIDTRNITGLDSDKYDNRAPDRPHFNSTPYTPPKTARFAFPPIWVMAIVLLALLPFIGVLAVWLWRLFEWIAVTSEYASDIDVTLIVGLKIAFALATSGVMLAILVSIVFAAMSRLTVRLPNNMPISALEMIFGGSTYRSLVQMSIADYYRERQTLWQNSRFWALETLDLSTSNAPRISGGDVIDIPAPDVPLLPDPAGIEPMSATLVQRGLIGRSGNSLLVGFSAADKPHYIELADTGFIAIAGYARVGKSSTASFLAAQAALIPNAELFVVDKHARRHDSLTRRIEPLAPAITAQATEIDEIVALIDRWFEIGRDRLLIEQTDLFPPVFLIIDEFTAMILLEQLPEPTLKRMLSGSVEFPKVQTHGIYIAHQFTGRLLGGSLGAPLRRVTTQKIVHRIDMQDAEFLLQDRKLARNAGALGDGRAILFGASQTTPVEIAIPYMSARDMQYIGELLPARRNAGIAENVASVTDVSNASQRPATTTNGYSTNTDNTIGHNAAIGDLPPVNDKYNENTALHFLRQKYADGTYKYSIRDVQSFTNLRTQTIVNLAHSIGRGRNNESEG